MTPCHITTDPNWVPPLSSSVDGNGTEPGGAFGGERNPDNKIFVFDAAYCPANQLIGVALSDGTLRLISWHGQCMSIVSLPGRQSYLTSFCWDSTGTRLATCVASGHLVTWHIDAHSVTYRGLAIATCMAVLEDGKFCLIYVEGTIAAASKHKDSKRRMP